MTDAKVVTFEATEAKGRNGYFKGRWAEIQADPFTSGRIWLDVWSKRTGKAPPLRLELSQVDARALAEALAMLAGTPASAERREEPRTYILTFTTEDLAEPWNERVTEYNVAYLEEGGTPLRTWGELDPDERQEIAALVIKEVGFVTESSTAEAIYTVVGNVAVSYATGTPL